MGAVERRFDVVSTGQRDPAPLPVAEAHLATDRVQGKVTAGRRGTVEIGNLVPAHPHPLARGSLWAGQQRLGRFFGLLQLLLELFQLVVGRMVGLPHGNLRAGEDRRAHQGKDLARFPVAGAQRFLCDGHGVEGGNRVGANRPQVWGRDGGGLFLLEWDLTVSGVRHGREIRPGPEPTSVLAEFDAGRVVVGGKETQVSSLAQAVAAIADPQDSPLAAIPILP